MVTLSQIVPRRPNVVAAAQADVAGNRVLSAPGTLADQKG
jgi:hypothetical protein